MTSKKFLSIAIVLLLPLACNTRRDATVESVTNILDTTQFKQVDSVSISTRRTLPDTILTVTTDTVRALYYPNTGKEVMKLVKGDVCKITRTGRYDIIDNKGNFWVRVERFGGKGWIFGGNTSLKSDIWVFSEGMTELGHPYIKYKLNKITAPNFEDLFEAAGNAIEDTEYSSGDDEAGTRSVDAGDDEIVVIETDDPDIKSKEVFRPGPALDSLFSINYQYNYEDPVNKISFNHTLIVQPGRPRKNFESDFAGELKNIYKIGGGYLLIADYVLTGSSLGRVHYANMAIWSTKKNKIIGRQRLGYSAVDIEGFPIFKYWDDGSFIADSQCTFAQTDGMITLEVFETYNRVDETGRISEKVFYITRYFTFDETTNRFRESKQEVIYEAK